MRSKMSDLILILVTLNSFYCSNKFVYWLLGYSFASQRNCKILLMERLSKKCW